MTITYHSCCQFIAISTLFAKIFFIFLSAIFLMVIGHLMQKTKTIKNTPKDLFMTFRLTMLFDLLPFIFFITIEKRRKLFLSKSEQYHIFTLLPLKWFPVDLLLHETICRHKACSMVKIPSLQPRSLCWDIDFAISRWQWRRLYMNDIFLSGPFNNIQSNHRVTNTLLRL